MKSIIIALSLFLTIPAMAANNPDGGTSPISVEDAGKIRDGVKAIGQAFGVTPAQVAQQVTQAPQKSMADVADKALGMFGGLVANVSNMLKNVAPYVWKIMIRQQYAKAIADIILPLMLLFLTIIYFFITRKMWKFSENFSSDEYTAWLIFTTIAPIIFGIIFFIWTANNVSESIKYLINPEYYAVKDILTMILNPGAM